MPSSVAPIASVGDGVEGSNVMLVSHPPVCTCSNPALQRYKTYLQSVYRARDLAPADKYLPTLKTKYINLAILHKRFYSCEQRDEFTRATLHGGIDEILQNKSPISMEDLMTKSDEPVKFILVEGPPGIGKSTFAWEVCRKWDEIPKLRDYDVVVLVRLREKWALNATSLPDLFRYPPNPGLSTSIAEELNMSQGRNLVLVLDGFDEVSHKFHEDSVLKSILRKELLPECAIILTTRPAARSMLVSVFQPQVNKHIEIIGFTEEERVRYVTQVFSDKPELQRNFLKYMFHIPHMKSMMYVPLNCAIIAQVYDESQGNRNLAIPRTKTQLYQALTHSLITRYMKSKENDIDTCTCTSTMPEGLPEEEMAKFKILAKFAFDSYHSEEKKVTFFEEDVPGGIVHFGFMNESTTLYADRGMEQTFSFLHLSLQEYLAAWHLANGYSTECQIAYHKQAIYKNFKNETYSSGEVNTLVSMLVPLVNTLAEPAKFLAGITGMRCKSVDSSLWEEYLKSIDINAVKNRILFGSFFDAQNPEIVRQCFSAKERWPKFSIGRYSTPHDSYAISYCLSHFSAQFDLEIYLEDENSSHMEMFARGLHDYCKSSTVLKVKCLDLYVSTTDFEMSRYWICDVTRYFVTELKTIYINTHREEFFISGALIFLQDVVNLKSLEVCSAGGIACWGWLDAVTSLNRLTKLHISSREQCSPPLPDSLHVLIQSRLTTFICHIATVQGIALSSTPPHVHAILKSVIISKQIVILDIQSVSREAMASIRNILLHCHSLTKLKLSEARLGYDGILHICSALRNNTTLDSIEIYDEIKHTRFITETALKCYCDFDLIDTVALPRKITSAGFLLELNDILKTNRTLRTMNIRSELFWPFLLDIELENILPVRRDEFQLPIELDFLSHYIMLLGLQQFNAGIIRSGIPPKLKRSYSSSDLNQPQISLSYRANWCGTAITANELPEYHVTDADRNSRSLQMNMLLLSGHLQPEQAKRLYSIPSFTAPDTDMLQPLSKLDPRLKACLTSPDSMHLKLFSSVRHW